jgi:rhodanese-related sulfurtransferase
MRLKRLVIGVLTIVILSAVLGIASHFSLVRRFFGGEFRESFVDAGRYPGIVFITRAEVEDLIHSGQAVAVDSRTQAEFSAGHIPGAINVPLDSSERALADLAAKYPLGQLLVVYCEGGDCQTSTALARLIYDKGFRDIRVYQGGWTDWTAAGLPAEASR